MRNLLTSVAASVAVLLLISMPVASQAPQAEKTFSGTLTKVDAEKRLITVKGTGNEPEGGVNGEKEQRQETWPIFAPGTATKVANGPLNIHVEPALWATVLTALPAGSMATVIAGPVEGEGIAWYEVATPEGVEGWCDGSYLQTL